MSDWRYWVAALPMLVLAIERTLTRGRVRSIAKAEHAIYDWRWR